MGYWKAGIASSSFAVLAACAVGQSNTRVFDVEQLSGPGVYMSGVQLQSMGTIQSHPAAQLAFSGLWSQIGINHNLPQNWTAYSGFAIRIENLENYPVSLGVRWDVNSQLNDYVAGNIDLDAREAKTFYMDLSNFNPLEYGMRAPFPALQETYTHRKPWINKSLNTVFRIQVYNRLAQTTRVKLGSIEGVLVDNSVVGFVDEFGQYTRRTWPWRKFDANQIRSQNTDEEADLAANPGKGETLGSTSHPVTSFTGRWRAVRTQSGKAYFLTPGGRYFWSLGATSVCTDSRTIVEGREMMFTSLPPFGTPKAQFYGTITRNGQLKRTYSHYSANLLEKYGELWPTSWVSKAKRRFQSWGLNTLGSGSDIGGPLSQQGIPFVKPLVTYGYSTRLQTPIAYWSTFPDPFAPDFVAWMTQSFQQQLQPFLSNPLLMGVYVDGEQSWGLREGTLRERYQVPLAALSAPKAQPAKQAFANHLFVKYGSIGSLNAAWGTSFTSWAHLRDSSHTLSDAQVTLAAPDLSAFLYNFAKAYAFRIRAAIRNVNPNILWLGGRESYHTCPNEAFGGLQFYTDVISVTHYDSAEHVPWSYFANLKKPVLIAEFSFTSREGNSFPQMVFPRCDTNTQEVRAQKARAYMDRAITNKNIIGLHWFTYVDRPISGDASFDENFAFGLVDVTDQPYQDLVNAFRSFSATMYSRRGL